MARLGFIGVGVITDAVVRGLHAAGVGGTRSTCRLGPRRVPVRLRRDTGMWSAKTAMRPWQPKAISFSSRCVRNRCLGTVMSGRRPLIKGLFRFCACHGCGHVFGLVRGE